MYLWAMAVWRRTQFAKFTRGERKLWAKAITAFWVVELVTLVSFILIYFWLSWGPLPLNPRMFIISRKSIITELIIFSYIIFLTYIAKLSLKWNLWRSQLYLSLAIIIIFSYLLWKDILLLLMRDNLYLKTNARWRNIRLTAVVYSLSHEWWTQHLIGPYLPQASFPPLSLAIQQKIHPFKSGTLLLNDYISNSTLSNIKLSSRQKHNFPILNFKQNFINLYANLDNNYIHTTFYPRRTGFVPKRLTMWQLVIILKMWHHLIILLWWTLYTYRLLYRRKTSYMSLNICYFNIYCCYLLALIVYSLYYVTLWELFLKFRPNTFNLHRFIRSLDYAASYNYRLILSSKEDYIPQFWLNSI